MAAARGRRCRGAVLLLLLASVLAPLVLYSDSPVSHLSDSTVARGAFDLEGEPNLVWPQMAASDVSLAKDLTIERLGEHKNRVLSATDDWQVVEAASRSHASGKSDASIKRKEPGSPDAGEVEDRDDVLIEGNGGAQSRQDGMIKAVVSRERSADGFGESGDSNEVEMQDEEGMKDTELQDASASEVEHKDGSGELGENNFAGMRTTGNLNSSFKQESTADRLSEQTTHVTLKESYTWASNSNAALPTTNSAAHSTTSPDAAIRTIKDQLTRAKTYFGFVASRGNHSFAKELRPRMRDIQRALGDATSDGQLPQNVHSRITAMEQTLGKGKKIHDNCSGGVNRLRAALHSTEEQLQSHKKEANYLAQIAGNSLPKGLNCLPLKLTNEYYSTNSSNKDFPYMGKLEDPKLYHYALFSDNVLATAVVVNSTLVHAKNPANHVFHFVMDRLNYATMKMWFLANPLGKPAVQVQNIEEFTWLNSSYSPVLKQLESQFMINYYFRAVQLCLAFRISHSQCSCLPEPTEQRSWPLSGKLLFVLSVYRPSLSLLLPGLVCDAHSLCVVLVQPALYTTSAHYEIPFWVQPSLCAVTIDRLVYRLRIVVSVRCVYALLLHRLSYFFLVYD